MHPSRPHPSPAPRGLGARLSDGLLELGLRVLLSALERAEHRAARERERLHVVTDSAERDEPAAAAPEARLRPDVEREARGEPGAERVLRVA